MKKIKIEPILFSLLIFVAFLSGIFIGRVTYKRSTVVPRDDAAESSSDIFSDNTYSTEIYINGKININAANIEDLSILPGIGQSIAQNIVDYRNEHGPFKNIDELKNIYGIGNAIIDNIHDYLTVGN